MSDPRLFLGLALATLLIGAAAGLAETRARLPRSGARLLRALCVALFGALAVAAAVGLPAARNASGLVATFALEGGLDLAFGVDAVTRLVALVAAGTGLPSLFVASRSRRGRVLLAAGLAVFAASAATPLALLLVASLQGRLLVRGAGAGGRAANLIQAAADLLAALALALLATLGGPLAFRDLATVEFLASAEGSSVAFLAGLALALSALLRSGAPPFGEALAPLARGGDPARLVERLLGPGFTAVLFCARAAPVYVAADGAALVLTLLGVLVGIVGVLRALGARTRTGLLHALVLATGALALMLVGLGSPDLAVGSMLALALATAPLILATEVLRQEIGSDRLARGVRMMRRRPLLGLASLLGAASLVGVPPTLGFTALDALRWRAIAEGPGHGWLLWAAVLAIGTGAACAAGRWWIASFFGGTSEPTPRRAARTPARAAVVAALFLALATPFSAPHWTGLADRAGDLLAAALALPEGTGPAFGSAGWSSSGRVAPAGFAFGLIGAMATLAGLYLAHHLQVRDPEGAKRLAMRAELEAARGGPRFLRRVLADPVRRAAMVFAEDLVEGVWGRGARRRIVGLTRAAGQRTAALQTGSFRLYAALGLTAFLLLLLSLAR